MILPYMHNCVLIWSFLPITLPSHSSLRLTNPLPLTKQSLLYLDASLFQISLWKKAVHSLLFLVCLFSVNMISISTHLPSRYMVLFFVAEQYPIVYIVRILSSTDGWWDWPDHSAIGNVSVKKRMQGSLLFAIFDWFIVVLTCIFMTVSGVEQ